MPTIVTAANHDLSIIRDILSGNKDAYEQLMRKYNQQLFRIGIAFTGTEEGVEDIMQNTYLKAWYYLPQFKADAAFNTWLVRIMINECKQALRKKERERNFQQQWQQNKTAGYEQGIQQSLIHKEMKEAIQLAILQLPVKYRTVFILREVEHLSTEETAAHLDLSPENVKVRLLRSKAMIRKELMQSVSGKELFQFYLTRCDRVVESVMREVRGRKSEV